MAARLSTRLSTRMPTRNDEPTSAATPANPAQPADFRRLRVLDEQRIGLEGRLAQDDHLDLKLWLRLLSCSTQIEQAIRASLRQQFDTTLPRFDYLAQLQRHPKGLRMNALSRYLMVTGGNVTGLTDQLVAEGWVARADHPGDRRSTLVSLTPVGLQQFNRMAQQHERWLHDWLAGFASEHKASLYELLGRLRVHLADQVPAPAAAAAAASAATAGPAPATDAPHRCPARPHATKET